MIAEANGTCMRSARMRAMMSVPPPAGNPTMRRSVRLDWAKTRVAAMEAAAASSSVSKRRRGSMRSPRHDHGGCAPSPPEGTPRGRSAGTALTLLRLEPSVFHHLLRDHPLLVDLGGEFRRRVDRRHEAAGEQRLVAEAGFVDDLGELGGELVDDRLRRAGGDEQAVPALRGRTVIAGL